MQRIRIGVQLAPVDWQQPNRYTYANLIGQGDEVRRLTGLLK